MKELLIAKKQELEAKRAEILSVNVDELIAKRLADFEAELRNDYAEVQKTEIDNIDMKISVIDELIDEIDNIVVETAMAMEPVAQPVVETIESTPVDTVDVYEVPNEA